MLELDYQGLLTLLSACAGPSLSQTELSSGEVAEESNHQESEVSNARPFRSRRSSDPGIIQTLGLPGDTFTSPEYSTDSVDSQSHTQLSSEDVEEETKHQGSKVSNATPFTHKSLVTSHQYVTCASFSPTMQVPSGPAGGGSGPPREPDSAAVKGECKVNSGGQTVHPPPPPPRC